MWRFWSLTKRIKKKPPASQPVYSHIALAFDSLEYIDTDVCSICLRSMLNVLASAHFSNNISSCYVLLFISCVLIMNLLFCYSTILCFLFTNIRHISFILLTTVTNFHQINIIYRIHFCLEQEFDEKRLVLNLKCNTQTFYQLWYGFLSIPFTLFLKSLPIIPCITGLRRNVAKLAIFTALCTGNTCVWACCMCFIIIPLSLLQ